MHALVIEDDVDLAANITDYLEAKDYQVDYAGDGLLGLHLATTTDVDVVVLDLCLPGMDGVEICKQLKRRPESATPIIMLTARDSLESKLEGFDAGADDYLVKPFALAELERRLYALHRRSGPQQNQICKVGDLMIDSASRSVERAGVRLQLSNLEFELLTALGSVSPSVLSKGELVRQVWGDAYVEDETIRSHIYQLRKLVDKPFAVPLIQTVRGYGHCLREPEDKL